MDTSRSKSECKSIFRGSHSQLAKCCMIIILQTWNQNKYHYNQGLQFKESMNIEVPAIRIFILCIDR